MNSTLPLLKKTPKAFACLSVIAFFTLIACNGQNSPKVDLDKYKAKGDSIALIAQGELLTHLSQAIADSGFAHAVNYCSLHANELTNKALDSHSIVSIQRLSDKNRNADNALKTAEEKAVFNRFNNSLTDTITIQGDLITYYKPIRIMMPTCLNCHGKKNELDVHVKEALQIKYPNDLAIDYSEGDLRGMWKIAMQKQKDN